MRAGSGNRAGPLLRHCEERSDEATQEPGVGTAIKRPAQFVGCFAALAMGVGYAWLAAFTPNAA
jgi:hypothetical protein